MTNQKVTPVVITQELLKQLLHYDPETGVFTWRVARGGSQVGDVAGHECFKGTKAYIIMGINGRIDRAHRLAFVYMTGDWPNDEVDHINGDGTDNRWDNLRDATRVENCRNMRLHNHNTSGVSGVSWRKQRDKWRAYITVENRQINLGHFTEWWDAVCARKSAERHYGFHPNHGTDRPL